MGFLAIVILLSSGAELLSLGAVIPFLMVLSEPGSLWDEPIVHTLVARLGYTQASQLVVPAATAFGMAALLAGAVRLLNLWLNGRLTAQIGSDLSCEAYRRTLYQPYEVHARRNSADVIKGTTTEITFTVRAITALLQMSTSAAVAIGLICGLVVFNWRLALIAISVFGSAYLVLAVTVRRELQLNSKLISNAARQQIKALQEGLGAIREVILNSNQETYIEIYRKADLPQRRLQAQNLYLSLYPRYAMEALGLIGIAAISGSLAVGDKNSEIPFLGFLALCAQRLLPALQQVYSEWSALKGLNANIAAVASMLDQPLPRMTAKPHKLEEINTIRLEGVHYRYASDMPEVLKGLSLVIKRGERIGLIGSTGSGKSTTIDILMGLLTPSSGRVLVDGVDINSPQKPGFINSWRASIAHVPQNIYLADCSITENIAFGVPANQIDFERVKQAARKAQIDRFIESSSGSYESTVGEKGIRLSGGQRQRIAIARALYKGASILILDEATSALDNQTETAVMEEIKSLEGGLTIISVAHRLSSLKGYDRILEIKGGILTLDELI